MRSLLSLLLPVTGTLLATVTAIPIPGNWAPAQGGCWTDNVDHQRALDRNLGGADDMTPGKCQSLCEAQGFSLAGVEYGRECYCGNTIFGNNRPSLDPICNMPCSGDAGQTCGGPDAINIYVKDSFPYTTGPATALSSYSGFENPRCWHDRPSSRIFTAHPSPETPGDLMTVQKCIDGCAAAGFSSAGLEFGRECFCGDEGSPLAAEADINECNKPCLGDASQFCGNADRLLIYHKPSTDPTPTPTGSWSPAQGGCWSDNADHQRALEHPAGSFDDLTPEKCQNLCEAAGFSLAGVEFARECFCGNTIMGNNRPSSSSICNRPCTGDSSKKCGGADAINIYVKENFQYTLGPATVLESYNGYSKTQCWQDQASNRILKQGPATPIPADSMTVQKCIDGCAAAGFSSAGVEFGKECFCDNVTYPPGQSEQMNECNKPCTGDGSRICGGSDRVLIYNKPATPPVITYRGRIEVYRVDTNALLGYLAREAPTNKITTFSTVDKAQIVTFQAQSGATSATQLEFTKENTADNFPFLGLVQGFISADSDLEPGTIDYLLVSGTPHSEPGATPQTGSNAPNVATGRTNLKFESSVWSIDFSTGALIPQWVNSNGSRPAETIVYNPSARVIFVVGDVVKFKQYQGEQNDYALKFKFVQIP